MTEKHQMIEEWAEWLNKERWDMFITITFRHSMPLYPAIKAFKQFFKYLNTNLERFFDKFITCWVFFEKDADRKGVHIHALIKGIDTSKVSLLEQICNRVFGQSKAMTYDSSKKAKQYLANKHNTHKLEHYDYYKINSSIR